MPRTVTPETDRPPTTATTCRSAKYELQRLRNELRAKMEQVEQINKYVRQPSGIERLLPFFCTRAD